MKNNESIEDAYQVMKFCGDELDNIVDYPEYGGKNYWDLNNLWWNAASIYVPNMRRLNSEMDHSN